MSDLESTDWSEIAANNIQPAPAGWPSGSSPTIVYATDREMMGAIKRDWNRRNPTITSGGSANVQTLTYSVAPSAMVRGQCYCFIAGFSNSSAMTLNVNGLGAIAVQIAGNALTGGEIIAGTVVEMVYTGTNFQIISGSGYLALAGGTVSGILTVSGQGIIKGTATNDSAAAGFVGEVISNNVTSPVTLTNNTSANIASITLTAGDWDVTGEVWFTVGAGGATIVQCGTSINSATLAGSPALNTARMISSLAIPATTTQVMPVRASRASLATSTIYYMVAQASFPSGTTTAIGNIWARRMR